jgi:16S rRNA (guanine527-N7)-methyltransferase
MRAGWPGLIGEEERVSRERLQQLSGQYGIVLSDAQVQLVEAYCRLLWEWNTQLNLTRHTTLEQFVARDLLDADQLARQLHAGESVLDVGSGGGMPGVLLAILRPDVRVTLSESVVKKARALEDMVARLGLNVQVRAERAEAIVDRERFDVVVARAVGSLPVLLGWFRHHWHDIGRMLLVKGPRWVDERKEARHYGLLRPLELRRMAVYPMPGTQAQSVILGLWPKQAQADSQGGRE